jgi:N-acetyl-gamma-glutamyl-phosphate reductase
MIRSRLCRQYLTPKKSCQQADICDDGAIPFRRRAIMKKKAIIIGATGFGGMGLIEILTRHPHIEITQLIARKDTNVPVSSVFPHLKGYCDLPVEDPDKIRYDADIAFFSTPDRAGMTIIHEFFKRGIPVIDYSGDFRFNTLSDYEVYAKNKGMDTTHAALDILPQAVYGLPEKYADKIRTAKVVGNPGCFAICMTLGMLPAVENGLIVPGTIICDGKSGVSGAGKTPGEANYLSQRNENVNTYREGRHQHLVEVENEINKFGKKYSLFFVPQVVPMSRGILNCIYADPIPGLTTEKILNVYRTYYKDSPFVVVTDKSPNTTDVRGSNRCEIRPMIDARTGKLLIVSAIDNLMKGQSGNAVQNANIMLGFDEKTGLDHPGFYP